MKKFFTIFIMAMLAGIIGASAQTTNERILVREATGNIKGFLPERVDSIFFGTVEGPVKAEMSNVEFNAEEGVFTLSITRTEECNSFRICVVSPNYIKAGYMNDPVWAAYLIENIGSERYWTDFTDATLSGFDELTPDADYMIATLGYDGYGIACGVDTYSFHTPAPVIVGNPNVEAVVDEVTATSFTITCTPNADVSEYFWCSFEAGTMQSQFDMWSGFMGFNSPAEMIAAFCWNPIIGQATNTWTDMSPGVDYEVYIAMKDINGNFCPDMVCVPVTTLAYGGDGNAEVEIVIGDYFYSDDYQTWLQPITYIPNAETNFYTSIVREADPELTDEVVKEYLMSDPYNGMYPDWKIYGEQTYWYSQIESGKTYWAFALPQNAAGEWGELAKVEFTAVATDMPDTPEEGEAEAAPAKIKSISGKVPAVAKSTTRNNVVAPFHGMKPANKTGLQLIQK